MSAAVEVNLRLPKLSVGKLIDIVCVCPAHVAFTSYVPAASPSKRMFSVIILVFVMGEPGVLPVGVRT